MILYKDLQEKRFIIAGPNVIETEEHAFEMARKIKEVLVMYDVVFIFKASFDKANRTSLTSYRGVKIEVAKRLFNRVRKELGVPCITDIHESWQAAEMKECVDILQIPAFLCRQTDLLKAASETGKILHIKKGQFCSAEAMKKSVEKCAQFGNNQAILCERGSFFGYQDLVVDPRNLELLRGDTNLVSMDITHCLQLPSQRMSDGTVCSGGQRDLIPLMGKMAIALDVHGIFVEVHDQPDESLCDAPTQWPLSRLAWLMNHIGISPSATPLASTVRAARATHFCGVGKSQLAAIHAVGLLKSLSVDARFLNPTNSAHGDIGSVNEKDVLVLFSKSGTTAELEPIAAATKERGCRVVGITCTVPCKFQEWCDEVISLPFKGEVDAHINCLPTNSVVAQISFVNTLAAELSSDIDARDYKSNHAGGMIGYALKIVRDVMRTDFPRYETEEESAPIIQLMLAMSEAKLGMVAVRLGSRKGIVTDGDIRRFLIKNMDSKSIDFVNEDYVFVQPDMSLASVDCIHSIVPVVEGDSIVGMLKI